RRLRDQGRGIIFITHKLDEVLAIANRVTVIRRGATQPPLNTKALSADTLRAAIFGDLNDGQQTTNHEPRTTNYELRTKYYKLQTTNCPPPLLTIKDLAVEAPGLAYIRNVNLRLTGGRILGIAGVRDSGLETLELAVSGLLDLPGKRPDTGRIREPRKFEGSIALNGREIAGKGVRAFREAGGAYLGADRLGGSLAPEQPLKESLIIHAFRRARRAIFLDMAYLDSWCMSIMRQAGIERSVSDKASSFSGGMLQRILLAREFAENASLIVLSDPGSGLDQQNQIRLMEELKSRVRGRPDTGALLFSTDMEELISTADEIMVLRNGTITGHFIQNPPGDEDVPDASGSSGKNRVLSAHELRAGIIAAMAGTVRAGTMQENHGA
ncbi:MAG: ATP-binding cassette domain-containing protein, partial [Treponema sp.]|nr:ATP-binding cassette domain-containing protein [Treponema sp.]